MDILYKSTHILHIHTCVRLKKKQNQTLNLSHYYNYYSITEVTSGGNNTCSKNFIWLSSLIVLLHILICLSATKGME